MSIRWQCAVAGLVLIGGCSVWELATPFTKNTPPPEVPEGVVAHRELVFAQRPTRDLHLDIYIPDDAPDPAPLMVYIFGGGFFMGSRHSVGQEPAIWSLLDEGVAIATVDYRYSSEALYPAQVQDVTAGICWLRANAERYGLDAENVFLSGHSAGGHLAALVGVGADQEALRDPTCDEAALAVQGVVDFFGPTRFSEWWSADDSVVYDEVNVVFGGPPEEHPSLVALADVLDKVDPSDPPFLIFHGTADTLVPLEHSQALSDLFDEIDHDAELHVLDGAPHGGADFQTPEIQAQVAAFLSERVGAQ